MVIMVEEEVDFIKRKYIRHVFQIILTFLFVSSLLTLDIVCLISESLGYQDIYLLFELVFCFAIMTLALFELRYYYRVKNNRFGLLYTSIISQATLSICILLLIILYITNLLLQILFVYLKLYKQENHTCRYFHKTDIILQYEITTLFTIFQTIMMIIPFKIRKTLQLLQEQQKQLIDLVPNVLNSNQQFDIIAVSGEFLPFTSKVMENEKQKTFYVSKSQLQKTLCMICTSRIWKSARIIRLPCNHIFHKQCFLKYSNSIVNRNSLLIKCEVCGQEVENKNLQSLQLEEAT